MPGNVTGMQTVWTGLTKTQKSVIIEPATQRQSTPVTMENVFLSSGSVTMMTTVGTTVTSQLTSVARETALRAGEDVPVSITTDVSRSGSSVTARTTAGTARTSCQRTVPSVQKRETSSVGTRDVSHRDGCVTLRMTA